VDTIVGIVEKIQLDNKKREIMSKLKSHLSKRFVAKYQIDEVAQIGDNVIE
jgi:hypothetical protein